MNMSMFSRIVLPLFAATIVFAGHPQSMLGKRLQSQRPQQNNAGIPDLRAAEQQLMALANQARAKVGAPPLRWDAALAEAARKHTLRMVAEGPIAHIYPGELDLTERAGLAGAHFDV